MVVVFHLLNSLLKLSNLGWRQDFILIYLPTYNNYQESRKEIATCNNKQGAKAISQYFGKNVNSISFLFAFCLLSIKMKK